MTENNHLVSTPTGKVGFRRLPDGCYLYHPFSEYVSHAFIVSRKTAERMWSRHDSFGKLCFVCGLSIYPLASFSTFLTAFSVTGCVVTLAIIRVYVVDYFELRGSTKVHGQTVRFADDVAKRSHATSAKDFLFVYAFTALLIYASFRSLERLSDSWSTANFALSSVFIVGTIYMCVGAALLTWGRVKRKK